MQQASRHRLLTRRSRRCARQQKKYDELRQQVNRLLLRLFFFLPPSQPKTPPLPVAPPQSELLAPSSCATASRQTRRPAPSHPWRRYPCAKNLGWQTCLEEDRLKSGQRGNWVLAKAELLAMRFLPRAELLTQRVPRERIFQVHCSREEALAPQCQSRHDPPRSSHHQPCNRPSSPPGSSLGIAHRPKALLQFLVRPWQISTIIAVEHACPRALGHLQELRDRSLEWSKGGLLRAHLQQQRLLAFADGLAALLVVIGQQMGRLMNEGRGLLQGRPQLGGLLQSTCE